MKVIGVYGALSSYVWHGIACGIMQGAGRRPRFDGRNRRSTGLAVAAAMPFSSLFLSTVTVW
jgi:hypothetical protein